MVHNFDERNVNLGPMLTSMNGQVHEGVKMFD